MRKSTVNAFLLSIFLFFDNHGAMHLKRKKNQYTKVYFKNVKSLYHIDRKKGINCGVGENRKINIQLFLFPNKRRLCERIKTKKKMTRLLEGEEEEEEEEEEQQKQQQYEPIDYCFEKNEYDFKDISNSLNTSYWEDWRERSDMMPPPLIQIAPMINVTTRHFRALMRMLTNRAQLWTEMVVDNTLLYNLDNLEEHLGYDETEHPIVCQLGGSDCTRMAEAAVLVEQFGYDELNINIGCPSNKVANEGCFGASLMKQPEQVRKLVYEIKRKVDIPVSVKIRTGVDNLDSFEFLQNFVELVSSAGCTNFIVHARKAWLKGLDPKKNRKIPPLEYKKVYDLCQIYPNLKFTLNGGIQTLEEAIALLNGYIPLSTTQKNSDILGTACYKKKGSFNSVETKQTIQRKTKNLIQQTNEVDKTIVENGIENGVENKERKIGHEKKRAIQKINTNRTYVKVHNYEKNPLNGVMIGRAAMDNTTFLSQVDKLIYNQKVPDTAYSRRSILEAYVLYLDQHEQSQRIASSFELLKPVLGILKGMPGQRIFRNKLDTYIRTYANTLNCSKILEKAIHDVDLVAPGVLDLPLSDRKLQEDYINNF